jgi:hypothetical protein
MLHPSPFATTNDIQLVQPFVQRVTEWAIEIAVEKIRRIPAVHAATLPKLPHGIHR